MRAQAIIHECERRGVRIVVVDGLLKLRGNPLEVDAALVKCVRENRDAVIRCLEKSGNTDRSARPSQIGPRGFQCGPIHGECGPVTNQDASRHRESERETDPQIGPHGPHGPHADKGSSYAPLFHRVRPNSGPSPATETVTEKQDDTAPLMSFPWRGPCGPCGPQGALLTDPFDFTKHWGPSRDDPTPGIVIPIDWRSDLAAWPVARWLAWRDGVTAKLAGLGRLATVEEIRATEHSVYSDRGGLNDSTPIIKEQQ